MGKWLYLSLENDLQFSCLLQQYCLSHQCLKRQCVIQQSCCLVVVTIVTLSSFQLLRCSSLEFGYCCNFDLQLFFCNDFLIQCYLILQTVEYDLDHWPDHTFAVGDLSPAELIHQTAIQYNVGSTVSGSEVCQNGECQAFLSARPRFEDFDF